MRVFYLALLFFPLFCHAQPEEKTTEICVYGGTSAGVIAAYSAAKLGHEVLLVAPNKHLGGMSASGLGATDIGNKYVVKGLARDFYRRLGDHYGQFEAWLFEPHVAESLFNDYVERAKIKVLHQRRITEAQKEGQAVKSIALESSDPQQSGKMKIKADYFIDCSYEGDLMARSGISYTVGREGNDKYGESYNGAQLSEAPHQFPDSISPYQTPGDPNSGLLPGINENPMPEAGTGDKKVQAYNYRLCLTKYERNQIPFYRPLGYDPQDYELLGRTVARYNAMHPPAWDLFWHITYKSELPNKKVDANNRGGFSTDYIRQNWDYPEASYDEREEIAEEHAQYIKGLLYYLAHSDEVPPKLREEVLNWGYCRDEFTDNEGFPWQMYIREARRMIGETVMTEHHAMGRKTVKDGIALAAYQIDSHNCDRFVVDGMVKTEGDVQVSVPEPFPIAYSAITPKTEECTNVLVPVGLSASHTAYGSIRMEPVFMVLGQNAAIAASRALKRDVPVQQVRADSINYVMETDPYLDGSQPEVLYDNDETDRVRVNGEWQKRQDLDGTYNATAMSIMPSRQGEVFAYRFQFDIPKEGKYRVMYYVPDVSPSSALARSAQVLVASRAEGDAVGAMDQDANRGSWIDLGTYRFREGRRQFLEVNTKQSDAMLVADAVLLVPVE